MGRRALMSMPCVLALLVAAAAAADEGETAAGETGENAPAEVAAEQPEGVTAEAVVLPPQVLRLKYQEGEQLTYETKVNGVGSVHVLGQAQALDMLGNMRMLVTVEDVDDQGNYTLLMDMDVADLVVRMAGSPIAPPQQRIKARTTVSPRGETLDIQVLQEPRATSAQSPWNSEMAGMLTGGLDLKSLLIGQKVAAFPEEAVQPGSKWSGTAPDVQIRGQQAPIEIATLYEGNCQVGDRACARLDSTCTIQAAELGQIAAMLGMSGTTTTETRSWFDLEAGRIIASTDRTQVNMQANLPAELTGAAEAAAIFLEMFVETQTTLLPEG